MHCVLAYVFLCLPSDVESTADWKVNVCFIFSPEDISRDYSVFLLIYIRCFNHPEAVTAPSENYTKIRDINRK